MKNLTLLLILLSLITAACNSSIGEIFTKKTPHEKYEEKIEDTPEGKQWKAVAEKSLTNAVSVKLPYKIQGHFPAGKPRALSFEFDARHGEQITFNIEKNLSMLILYADVFKKENDETKHLYSANVDSSHFSFDAEENGSYIVRLQPQLNSAGSYSFSITTGPSIGFPVSDKKARVGSFWGDARDDGARRHEGIDIFAPKKSPVVAPADGYITNLGDGGIGGKTVWLRPSGKNYSLYYAHLHEQLVTEGQYVKKGDVIGLVGNTGNAKHTPPHLHFGIYTHGGAVDPLPFVNKATKAAPAVAAKNLTQPLKLLKPQKVKNGYVEANTILTPLAVTPQGWLAESPNGDIVLAAFTATKAV